MLALLISGWGAWGVDVDQNGLSDVWETAYSMVGADPLQDGDLDGQTNGEECVAGTDPNDSQSVFRIDVLQPPVSSYLVRWDSVAGKVYRVEGAVLQPEWAWVPLGDPVVGTGQEVVAAIPESGPAIVALRVRLDVNNPAWLYGREVTPFADTDGDAFPDVDEWMAGTNPFDANSRLMINQVGFGKAAVLRWSSVEGKQYRVQSSPTAGAVVWSNHVGVLEGDGTEFRVAVEGGNGSRFYRVQVSDGDDDFDGVTDWEEAVAGFDDAPWHYRTNHPTATNAVLSMLAEPSVIEIQPGRPIANATRHTPGSFRVTRSGNLKAITLGYSVGGDAVAGTHYEALSGTIRFPVGVHEVEIAVMPLSEAGLEPARSVVVSLLEGGGYAVGSNAVATVNVLREVPLSVTDFGAIGDGVTDDTIPIQSAIDALETSTAHNTLHFPSGTYRLNTPTKVFLLNTSWDQFLVMGLGEMAGRDLLITAAPGAELYSTVSDVRTRMLVVHSRFRSLTVHGLTWRKEALPLPQTASEPNRAEGVFLVRADGRRVEAVDFHDCRFINCHRSITVFSNGYDVRGRLANVRLRGCTLLNPYGSNTKNGAAAFGGGQQVYLNQWVGRAVYSQCLFHGGTNAPVDLVLNPGGIRKDGSHFGSPLELIFTNNIVRHMGVEAVFQTEDGVMGVLQQSFVVPPPDGTSTVEVLVQPGFTTTYQPGQIVNFRVPNTPSTQPRNVLLRIVAYDVPSRRLTVVNDGLSVGEDGTTVAAPLQIYLQREQATTALIENNIIEDEVETPVGLLGVCANARARIGGNFIRNYHSGIRLYEDVHNVLYPANTGTRVCNNLILAQQTTGSVITSQSHGIWSHGPEEIIDGNLVMVPTTRRFVGIVTRGRDGWVEGNRVVGMTVLRSDYDDPDRAVGIAAGNTSSQTVQVENWTYGMDVGNGPEKPYQSPPRRVITHHSTNDTLSIDPRGLILTP